MILEGAERTFSINALLRKSHTLIFGELNVETFEKEFPMKFVFDKSEDVNFFRVEIIDENGYEYSSEVHTEKIEGEKNYIRKDIDSFVVFKVKDGEDQLEDEIGY